VLSLTYNLKNRNWMFAAALTILLALFLIKLDSVHAQNIGIGGPYNCDANAVLYCGASSVDNLIGKYNNGDGVNSAASIHNIYNYFGINYSDIELMNSSVAHVQAGEVTKSGDVLNSTGGVIATGALTGGRQYISGSSTVNFDGTTFYTRPPSISFLNNALYAYVVTINGRFDFAILSSCGNPISARPISPPPVPPKPVPPKPVPTKTTTPAATTISNCNGNTTNSSNTNNASGGNCSTNTTVVQNTTTQAPPQQTASTPAVQATVTPSSTTSSLVNTGPGDVALVFIGAAASGIVIYQLVLRRKFAKERIEANSKRDK